MTTEQTYITQINNIPRMTKEEEVEAFSKIANGDTNSRNRIIEANLYVVVAIARKYCGHNVEFADLIQEGTFGLMKAIEKFDSSKGFCFATYASYWIKLAIQRVIQNKGRLVRVPSYIIEAIDKINRYTEKYVNTFGKEPTEEEIAKEFHLSVKKVKEYLDIFSGKYSLSIDNEMKEDDDTTFAENLEDTSASTEDFVIKKETAKELLLALSKLSEKERKIIELKFGLVDGREWTFEEISKLFGITRQGCQWLEKGAMNKLKRILKGKV